VPIKSLALDGQIGVPHQQAARVVAQPGGRGIIVSGFAQPFTIGHADQVIEAPEVGSEVAWH